MSKTTKPRYFKRAKKKVEPEKEKVEVKSLHQSQQTQSSEHTQKFQQLKRFRPHLPKSQPHKHEHSVKNRKLFGNSKVILKKVRLQWVAIAVLVVLAIVWNYIAASQVLSSFHSWLLLLQQREKLSDEMNLWGNIAKEYPNYRDAYVEGAIYAYRLGDTQKEQYFISQLQLLDPDFPLTKTLEQLTNLQSLSQ